MHKNIPEAVDAVISAYPEPARTGALRLREMIFDVASGLPQVGALEETLKWEQPAYLTSETKSGTTLRIGQHKAAAFALYAHCQTDVISAYATAFPGLDRIDGNRAILFDSSDDVVPARLRHLIKHALTYHLQAA